MRKWKFLSLSLAFLLSSCGTGGDVKKVDDTTPLEITAAQFTDLPGWAEDDHAAALTAFRKSCVRIMRAAPDRPFSRNLKAGLMRDWQAVCGQLPPEGADKAQVRAFFEQHFTPYKMRAQGGSDEGLFTGYYEASLRGSRTKGGPYTVPLHGRPADLVMVELGEFREQLKGQRIAGRVVDGRLKPYEDREKITAGNWPHNDQVIVWVDDPVDAFFLEIQGSGVVQLDDGTIMRVGYAGQNGHPYHAIGRELVKRGVPKEQVSMQAIRAWLAANPAEARAVMNTNRSYVFFVEQKEGPLGAENVVLTPGRSLAVDSAKMAYGVPVWLDSPGPGEQGPRLRRLMVAQDTGGAIRGAVRGDVYFGYGPEAEGQAGIMKSRGRTWLLLPRNLTPL